MTGTTFYLSSCELDFGNVCLGGDFTLTIETEDNGHSFKLVDAESCLRGVSKACFALSQDWIEDDVHPRWQKASHQSRVRAAYEDAEWRRCKMSEIAAMRADDLRDQRAA